MFRDSTQSVLITLAVGAVGGWVAAPGRLDALQKAEWRPQPV
jgi:hypothetical protein